MEILLAGPGTGKTTKVKSLIRENYSETDNILVLSFTNATVNDLNESFKGMKNVKCFTLHSYSLKINHLPMLHVLDDIYETPIIKFYADRLGITLTDLCYFLECITFEDMIIKCVEFLQNNPAYASEKIGSISLLIIDEFQDFNEKERELVSIISTYANRTLILGDDDQSIYQFKDADPLGIINLYNDSNVIKLNHHNICHRCPDCILDGCLNLISRNKNRIIKEWFKSGKDGDLIVRQFLTQDNTFRYILDTILSLRAADSNGTFLILSPVRFYIEELIEILSVNNLSYINFWTSTISKEDIIKVWWLKAIYGNKKLLFILLLSKEYGLFNKPKFRKLINDTFRSSFNSVELFNNIISLNYFPSALSQLFNSTNIDEFFTLYPDFIRFKEFIDEENLSESIDELERKIRPVIQFDKQSINLMSVHKSKGLQADYVFIYGLNEGVLPNEIKGLDTMEAQRRLLFVGMTRALKKLFLLSSVEWDGKYINKVDRNQFKYNYKKKKYYGRASRFLSELR